MIPEFKKILYPTDLSENARYAFGFAVSLANRVITESRGKGGLADVTMGSTSRRVMRRCRKPVLIVCPPELKG